MKILTDHWSRQQYVDLIATIKPGVTMKRLVLATKSSKECVLYRLRGLNLVVAAPDSTLVSGSTGWRWVKGVRGGKLSVHVTETGETLNLVQEFIDNGWMFKDGKYINPIFTFDAEKNQLMRGFLSQREIARMQK